MIAPCWTEAGVVSEWVSESRLCGVAAAVFDHAGTKPETVKTWLFAPMPSEVKEPSEA